MAWYGGGSLVLRMLRDDSVEAVRSYAKAPAVAACKKGSLRKTADRFSGCDDRRMMTEDIRDANAASVMIAATQPMW
jgi:hypothetical protein